MRLVTNTCTPCKQYSIEELVDMMHEAGFDSIDFSFDAAPFNKAEGDEFKAWLKTVRERAESKGMRFTQAHAPFPSSDADPVKTEEIFQSIVRSMEHASILGVDIIVVHPIQHLTYIEGDNAEKLFEMNMAFYRRLEPYCKQFGIKVALENMYQVPLRRKTMVSTCGRPAEFNRYLDELNSEWFVGCLDIGHAVLLSEDPANFIRELGKDRLKCLHVHDVDGQNDSHTLPYFGIVNWDSVAAALKEIGYEGEFTYECGYFFSPLPRELYPAAFKMAEATGRHLISKIEG